VSPIRATCPAHLFFLLLLTGWYLVRSTEQKTFLFSNTLSLWFSLNMTDQFQAHIKKTDEFIVECMSVSCWNNWPWTRTAALQTFRNYSPGGTESRRRSASSKWTLWEPNVKKSTSFGWRLVQAL
jgi:hypothetical protein